MRTVIKIPELRELVAEVEETGDRNLTVRVLRVLDTLLHDGDHLEDMHRLEDFT